MLCVILTTAFSPILTEENPKTGAHKALQLNVVCALYVVDAML